MLFALLIISLMILQTYLVYVPPNDRGNAINEKWRMYRRAKTDPIFDHNCKFFLLGHNNENVLAIENNERGSNDATVRKEGSSVPGGVAVGEKATQ